MRVLVFNIQSCRAGVERVAELLRSADADVMLLTEVRRAHLRPLARATRSHATFGVAWRRKRYGNAILTREPHRRVLRLRFGRTPGRQPRGMVAVRLASGVAVAATHLGLSPEERVRHATEALRALGEVPDPCVLGGDLNDLPGGPAIAVLLSRFTDAAVAVGAGSGATYPADAPRARIDYVLVSGLAVRSVEVLPTIASDHLALLVDVLDSM